MFWLDALEFKLQDKFYLVNTIFFHTLLGVANLCSDTKQQVTHAQGGQKCACSSREPGWFHHGETCNTERAGTSRQATLFLLILFLSSPGNLSRRATLSLVALVMSCYSSPALHDVTDAVSCVTSQGNHWREKVFVCGT